MFTSTPERRAKVSIVCPTAVWISAGTGCRVESSHLLRFLFSSVGDRPAARAISWLPVAAPSRDTAPSSWEIAPMSTTHTAPLPAVPTINLASLMYGLDDYLRERGADPDAILGRAGLALRDLTDPERRVPLIRFLRLLELCADALGDAHFGLRFGDPVRSGRLTRASSAMWRSVSSTVRRALQTIGRYLPTMVDSAVYRLDVQGGTAFSLFLLTRSPFDDDVSTEDDCGVAFHLQRDPSRTWGARVGACRSRAAAAGRRECSRTGVSAWACCAAKVEAVTLGRASGRCLST